MSQGVQAQSLSFQFVPLLQPVILDWWACWWCPMQLAVVLVRAGRILTLKSSFTLAFDQLILEEGILFEQFAFFPTALGPTVFSFITGHQEMRSFSMLPERLLSWRTQILRLFFFSNVSVLSFKRHIAIGLFKMG